MKHQRSDISHSKGFTLIELMVVISIVALISSIVFASLSLARAKAKDARKLADAAAVRTAIQAYVTDNNGKLPPSYNCTAPGVCTETTSSVIETGDGSGSLSDLAYQETMMDLVELGYLSAIPVSPDDTPYTYYNMGTLPGSLGATFSVVLKTRRPGSSSNSSSQCQIPASVFVPNAGGPGRHYIVYKFPDFPATPLGAGCQVWIDDTGAVTSYGTFHMLPDGDRCLRPPRCIQHTNSYCACSSL